ncbi:MAG: multiheme c-type cytochrome [Deltaproteobacteria bacterium]
MLLLDSGDLVAPPGPVTPVDSLERAAVVYGVLAKLGLAAAVPGEADLALGAERLRDVAAQSGVLLLGANLRDASGEAPFPASCELPLGDLRVGIVGALSPSLAPPGLQVGPAAPALREAIAELPHVDLVIALLHEPPEEDAPLALALPAIDVLVAAHGGVPEAPTLLPGGAVVVRTGNKNRFVGRLELESNRKDRPRLLSLASRATAARDAAFESGGEAAAASADRALASLAGRSWMAGRLYPLDSALAPDVAIDAALRRYRKAADAREIARLTPGAEARPEQSAYAGERTCARCHVQADAAWRGSRHAQAFETLSRVGSSLDPSCIGCHTTGFGLPGGFAWPAEVGFLSEVQCEACHGAGKAHVANPKAPYPLPAAGAVLCERCHTAERSPEFAFAPFLARIHH